MVPDSPEPLGVYWEWVHARFVTCVSANFNILSCVELSLPQGVPAPRVAGLQSLERAIIAVGGRAGVTLAPRGLFWPDLGHVAAEGPLWTSL